MRPLITQAQNPRSPPRLATLQGRLPHARAPAPTCRARSLPTRAPTHLRRGLRLRRRLLEVGRVGRLLLRHLINQRHRRRRHLHRLLRCLPVTAAVATRISITAVAAAVGLLLCAGRRGAVRRVALHLRLAVAGLGRGTATAAAVVEVQVACECLRARDAGCRGGGAKSSRAK